MLIEWNNQTSFLLIPCTKFAHITSSYKNIVCVASACAREGIEFDKTLMVFADAIDQEELVSWATTLNSSDETETAASAEDSKKKRRGS